MAVHNRLETTVVTKVVTELLADVSANYTEWFPLCAFRRTNMKILERCDAEGIGFITKTMPSLRKELDRALDGAQGLNCLRFQKKPGTELPIFMGEFFQRVFTSDGRIKPDPCVVSVRILRQVLDLFYKYKLPYDENTKQETISLFKKTDGVVGDPAAYRKSRAQALENKISCWNCISTIFERACKSPLRRSRVRNSLWLLPYSRCDCIGCGWRNPLRGSVHAQDQVRCRTCLAINQQWIKWSGGWYREIEPSCPTANTSVAKGLITRLLHSFDPLDIVPRHGPGAVSTGEKTWEKMEFRQVYTDLTAVYPLDTYFYVSTTHVADEMSSLLMKEEITEGSAKVVLVPKDSRGPRLISEEPCTKQWIQQGLMKALVAHIEAHHLTRGLVNFTDQTINRRLALQASADGSFATLDLKEASDRVSLRLVRELFPEHIYAALVATRSTHTLLPDGEMLKLNKFAPMGSALCFPVMALTIWAVATACVLRKSGYSKPMKGQRVPVYVYGDDVIIETQHASDVIKSLEAVGLMVNTSKCFITGSFRESCGRDAFRGEPVEPIRIKNVWDTSPDASTYASWIAYANSFWRIGFRRTAQLIAGMLAGVYGPIPTVEGCYWGFSNLRDYRDKDLFGYPHLMFTSDVTTGVRKRWNRHIMRFQHYVYTIRPTKTDLSKKGGYNGWSELLRYLVMGGEEFRAGVYANRRESYLSRRWR